MCYGRLGLTTRQIEECCICELMAMMEGWQQRHDDLEDLLIECCAMPVYQMHLGRKAPRFHDLVKRRKKRDEFADMSHDELLAFASE